LIFADALTRSWKQITKFRSASHAPATMVAEGANTAAESLTGSGGIGAFTSDTPPASAADVARAVAEVSRDKVEVSPRLGGDGAGNAPAFAGEAAEGLIPGLIRDERGVRLAPEIED
jgi:uncharacterized protein YjaZ